MSFGKEIYTLLLQHDIVIIPGLGAFVSEYRPAEISDDSEEIKPPSKIVSFNPLLKNNDGLVVGHIAEKLHISHFEALVRIEKEREDILFKLDKGDKVELEGVGILEYNEQGQIEFRASEEENILLDSFGLEPTSFKDPEPVDIQSNEPADHTEEPPFEQKPATIEPVESEKETDQSEEEIPEEEPDKGEETTVDKPKIQESEQIANPVEKKEKKKSGAWLFLLILIPLIAVAGFILYKGSNSGKADLVPTEPVNTEENQSDEPGTTMSDTVPADSMVVNTQNTVLAADSIQSIPATENTVEQDTVKYYLVGGSFSVKENADNYLLELQQKGYKAFHVGKKGRFFIVGIGSYKTFNDAEVAKTRYMEDNPGSEVWVYKK